MPIEIISCEPLAPLVIGGTADVYSASELRDALLSYIQSAPAPVVDISAVDGCDATGLQLLISARISARQAGKALIIDSLPVPVAEACVRLGVELADVVPSLGSEL